VTVGLRQPGAGRSQATDARLGRMAARSIAAALVVLVAAACSDSPDRSVAGYCGEISTNIALINGPSIATALDVEAALDLYRTIGEHAPAAVAPEWQVMIDSLETAATVVPGDPESIAIVSDVALSSQSAATRIQQYTKLNCGVDIGTPPPPTNPVTVTTLPPPPSTT
jgi:hypothetical protein